MYHSDDLRQMSWDSLMINGWGKDLWMGVLMARYCALYPDADLSLIRRFPRKWELTMNSRLFVARYIPKLSEKLWDDPKNAQFWLLTNGDKIKRLLTNSGSDKRKRGRDISEIRASKKIEVGFIKTSEKQNRIYTSYKRSCQWNVCK